MIQTKIIPGLVGCAASYALGYSYGKWAHVPPHLTGSVLAIGHLVYRLLKAAYEWGFPVYECPNNATRKQLEKFQSKVNHYIFHRGLLINLTAVIQMAALRQFNLLRKEDSFKFCLLPAVQALLLVDSPINHLV